MKQHITEEQLSKLTIKQRDKLVNWFTKKEWFPHYSSPQMMLHTFDFTLSQTIGIGQMIEFLQTYKKDKRYKTGYPPFIEFYQCGDGCDETWYIAPDTLCDDLWEACVEVLNKK